MILIQILALGNLDIENSEMVNPDSFASKSKNSPFIGRELFGHAKLTLLQGKIVYNILETIIKIQ